MRGTTYAISEIIWWMVAALAVGILIGWLLRRWFGGEARLKDVKAELEAKNVRYAELSGELGESKQLVESLNRDLEARAGELSEATARVGDLESNLSSARADLEASRSATGEIASGVSVGERDERIRQLESEVAGLKSDLKSTAAALAEIRIAHADCTVTAEATSGRIAGLETTVAERDARIADLEASATRVTTQPAAEQMAAAARSADLEGLAALEEQSERSVSVPLTAFGTAGADHEDDLKVINGIGPKTEELLKGFGIKAWDQVAALTPDEVARVDEALEESPGRIERDQWVEQARDLIDRFPDPRNRPDRKTFLNEGLT